MQILKMTKFWDCSSIRYFASPVILPILIFSLFDINEFQRFIFSIFIFYCSDSRMFGRSTFESSLIFKFEISVILKFYCSKF